MLDERPPKAMRLPGSSSQPPPQADYFVGPILGEFGHKIMSAGILRREALLGKHLIISDLESCRAIYADFPHVFEPHDIVCEGDGIGARADQRGARMIANAVCAPDAVRMTPREYRGQDAVFHRYGDPIDEFRGCVVFHARNRAHVVLRNWGISNWHQLARMLYGMGVKRIVCVGTKTAALAVEGALDLRGAPLQRQMDVLASAWFAVGPSSGPMHLASLCGCPHVVWCGGGPEERNYTKRRYDELWNPFRTPVSANLYASWRPEYNTVHGWVVNFMEKQGEYQDRNKDKPRRTHRGSPVLAQAV